MARFRPPLDAKRLEELALRYVGRYATSRAKLAAFLVRKIRERGWDGEPQPDIEGIAGRFAELGYVDDAAYALSKSQSLSNRGYGGRRLDEKLRLAGIGEEDGVAAREHAAEHAVDAALRYAQRRRIGPFAARDADPREREKAIAAMVRAGHSYALARVIADLPFNVEPDKNELCERFGAKL